MRWNLNQRLRRVGWALVLYAGGVMAFALVTFLVRLLLKTGLHLM